MKIALQVLAERFGYLIFAIHPNLFMPISTQANLQHSSTESASLRRALRVIACRQFSPFKVFIAREHGVVVVLSPKVGTTTFRHVMRRAYCELLGRKDASDGRYKLFRKARQFPYAPLRDYFQVFGAPEKYDFYGFVRNPYARLKSAWVDKLAFGHQEGYPPSIRRVFTGRSDLSQVRRFARRNDLAGSAKNSAIPFATFVDFVAAQRTGTRNHHWDEQFCTLFMDRIHYAKLFKMESDFVSGTTEILARIGVTESWARAALAQPCNQSRKFRDEIYTPELAETVQRIYARDFAALDYDVDSWRGL